MKKVFCFIALMMVFISYGYSQETRHDSGQVKFAPGTLAGKYYGTYDTTTKRSNLADSTRKIAGIQNQSPTVNKISDNGLAQRQQLSVNQNYDPVEVSGTTQASQIDVSAPGRNQISQSQSLSALPVINAPANTTQPVENNFATTTPYSMRLGSSTPQYDTYEKNKDGAGGITTNPNKGVNSTQPASNEGALYINPQQQARLKLGLLLGSSAPQYDTYQKNDDGYGAITNNPNKDVSPVVPSSVTNTDILKNTSNR